MPEMTPWGEVQASREVTPGVRWVSTASHGGLEITIPWAKMFLSEAARSRGIEFGYHLYFEEDCDWAIAYLEILTDPRMRAVAERERARLYNGKHTSEALAEHVRHLVAVYNMEYLNEIEPWAVPERGD